MREDVTHELFRLFNVGEMTCLLDRDQRGPRHACLVRLVIAIEDEAILRSSDQQSRHGDAMQPAAKPRVVHVGPPAIEG